MLALPLNDEKLWLTDLTSALSLSISCSYASLTDSVSRPIDIIFKLELKIDSYSLSWWWRVFYLRQSLFIALQLILVYVLFYFDGHLTINKFQCFMFRSIPAWIILEYRSKLYSLASRYVSLKMVNGRYYESSDGRWQCTRGKIHYLCVTNNN